MKAYTHRTINTLMLILLFTVARKCKNTHAYEIISDNKEQVYSSIEIVFSS